MQVHELISKLGQFDGCTEIGIRSLESDADEEEATLEWLDVPCAVSGTRAVPIVIISAHEFVYNYGEEEDDEYDEEDFYADYL